MVDNTDLHPVVQMLIARMDSHPEEFEGTYAGRWSLFIEELRAVATGDNLAVFEEHYAKVCLDKLHDRVLDELLNGDTRRAQMEAERANAYKKYASTQVGASPYPSAGQNIPVGLGGTGASGLTGYGLLDDPYGYNTLTGTVTKTNTITSEAIKRAMEGYKRLTGK